MHRMNWRSLVIPWILIIDFQSYCLGKSSTSAELGLLRKLIVHSHLHLYIIHYIHIYIRFYVISWWQRRMGIHLIGKCGNVLKNSAPISNFLVGECSWEDARYELKAMSAIPGTHATHLRSGSYHFRISGLKGLWSNPITGFCKGDL